MLHPGSRNGSSGKPAQMEAWLDILRRIQEFPARQLTSLDKSELNTTLQAIRHCSQLEGNRRLPADIWELADQPGGDTGLQLLLSRRIVADADERQAYERSALTKVMESCRSSAGLIKSHVGQRLLRSRYHSWYLEIMRRLSSEMQPGFREYARWQQREREVAGTLEELRCAANAWTVRPRISVVMAVRNPRIEWLVEAVQSVRDQVYGDWELCVCDDASGDPRIRTFLESLPDQDSRIVTNFSDIRLGESAAFNRSIELASGEFVACLDHDDKLAPEALHWVVEALQAADADVLYTDEDFINEHGSRIRPHFKPDWSPRLLDSCMYVGHMVVIRRKLFLDVEGFRGEFDGAQDFDLALRATERARKVFHVPHVAYHWRMHANSVSADARNKPRTHLVGQRVLESAIARRGLVDASVVSTDVPNLFFLNRRLTKPPKVDIVFVAQDGGSAGRVGALLRNTRYAPLEVVMAGYDDASCQSVASEAGVAIVRTDWNGARSQGDLANAGASAAGGEIVVFASGCLRAESDSWLEYLVKQLDSGGVGIAGGKVIDARGRIEHSGIALGLGDGAGRLGRGAGASPNWLWLDVPREVSAVDFDCLAIRRGLLTELNGFDVSLPPEYQAIDLCLRASQAGHSVVVETRSVLRREVRTNRRLVPMAGWAAFVRKWHGRLREPDPFYSPNLRADREEIRLA